MKSHGSPRSPLPISRILDLKPDLVLTFSDLQADIAATLIRANINVHAFNQRTVAQILDMIRTIGALVSAADRADRLAKELAAKVSIARTQAAQLHIDFGERGEFWGWGLGFWLVAAAARA